MKPHLSKASWIERIMLIASLHIKLVTLEFFMNIQEHVLCSCQMFSLPIIIIPLIHFSSLARPISLQWHLFWWSKGNDCFLSFVQCVRHYVTYVGSLPYLEPIIWWVGRQPTSAEIRVLKGIGGEKDGWCLHSIWHKWTVLVSKGWVEVALSGCLFKNLGNIHKKSSRGNPTIKHWCRQSQSPLSRLTLLSKRCEKKPFLLIALFIWAACLRLRGQAINVSLTYCWKTVCW